MEKPGWPASYLHFLHHSSGDINFIGTFVYHVHMKVKILRWCKGLKKCNSNYVLGREIMKDWMTVPIVVASYRYPHCVVTMVTEISRLHVLAS